MSTAFFINVKKILNYCKQTLDIVVFVRPELRFNCARLYGDPSVSRAYIVRETARGDRGAVLLNLNGRKTQMNDIIQTFCGVLLPFLGTAVGSAAVFLMKKELNEKVRNTLFGFASGVMLAASVWSLLLPAVGMSEHLGRLAFLPAAAGFLFGIVFLLMLEKATDQIERRAGRRETGKSADTMLLIAVTLHNLPEGMAVGAAFAGLLSDKGTVTAASVMALSIGIALQNLPEGAIVSLPLAAAGKGRVRSFLYGTLSGAIEPAGAALVLLLSSLLCPALPFFLSFAAGAMIYVISKELIPQSQEGKIGALPAVSTAIGFLLMMIMDVVFS